MSNNSSLKEKMTSHVLNGLEGLGYSRAMWDAVEVEDVAALNAAIAAEHAEVVASWQEALDTQPHHPDDTTWPYGWVYEAEDWLKSTPPFFNNGEVAA